ncbi:hypothetical protein N7449_007905 [Penicillium cf. viridicatum]|uniref:Uncharacterized protein n=1 Tax=Penicillium cf. viridicatum TaxID=2972119 RepID=A0A9W9MBX5_9EURO|nr:hypothetical protein N7449_007905 [Penicillium cf. viridicatum]
MQHMQIRKRLVDSPVPLVNISLRSQSLNTEDSLPEGGCKTGAAEAAVTLTHQDLVGIHLQGCFVNYEPSQAIVRLFQSFVSSDWLPSGSPRDHCSDFMEGRVPISYSRLARASPADIY